MKATKAYPLASVVLRLRRHAVLKNRKIEQKDVGGEREHRNEQGKTLHSTRESTNNNEFEKARNGARPFEREVAGHYNSTTANDTNKNMSACTKRMESIA